MAPLGTTNYQSILTQAQSQIDQLLKLTEDQDGQGSANASSYINSVWGITEGVEQVSSGDDSQKATAIQNIITKLTDLLGSLGTGESKKADEKVKQSDKAISQNDDKAAQTEVTVSTKLQEIMDKCTSGSESIEDAIKKIEELGGDDSVVTKAQDELEAQLAIIEENKAVLNDSSADSDKRKAALKNILGAASAINSLTAEVNAALEQIQAQQAVVKEKTDEIAELSTQSTQIIADGTQEIQNDMANSQQLSANNTQNGIDGAQNKVAGTVQKTEGESMQKVSYTAAEGVKYTMSGNDKINAGATLMSGAVKGTANLAKSVGAMGGYLTEFANFSKGIGQFVGGAAELVGQFESKVNPMIESVGSWDTVTEANEQLQSYVEEYSSSLPDDVKEEVKDSDSTTTWGSNNFTFNSSLFKTEDKSENITIPYENADEFKKFEFDTSIFKSKES